MKWKTLCLSAALTAVLAAMPAYALDYTVDAPEDYLFGRPTSVETVTEYGAVSYTHLDVYKRQG